MSDEVAVREIKKEPELFSRDDLLGIERRSEMFTPPGYDKAVEIQALNALEQSRYQSSILEMRTDDRGKVSGVANMEGAQIKLVALGMKNPSLSVEEIGALPNDFVVPTAERIREISGMNRTVEEAEGN